MHLKAKLRFSLN